MVWLPLRITRSSLCHVTARAQLRLQVVPDVGQGRLHPVTAEDGPLEERATLRIVGVLVERDDVRAVAAQHGGDRRDDAGPVLARDDQRRVVLGERERRAARCRFLGQRRQGQPSPWPGAARIRGLDEELAAHDQRTGGRPPVPSSAWNRPTSPTRPGTSSSATQPERPPKSGYRHPFKGTALICGKHRGSPATFYIFRPREARETIDVALFSGPGTSRNAPRNSSRWLSAANQLNALARVEFSGTERT